MSTQEIRNLIKRVEDLEKRVEKIEKLLKMRKEIAKEVVAGDIVRRFQTLDLSQYPYVHELKGLPLFLWVIKVARDKFNVDGLSPPEIAKICKEKLRRSRGVDRTGVSHALRRAKYYVDRVPLKGRRGYVYKIMMEGEKYLEKEIEQIKKEFEEESRD